MCGEDTVLLLSEYMVWVLQLYAVNQYFNFVGFGVLKKGNR